MSAIERILVVDDDESILSALGAFLEGDDRSVILCSDPEMGQLVVESMPVTHVISDVRLTGSFRFEGVEFLSFVRRRAPKALTILMTGAPSPELEKEAQAIGAVAFLTKPFQLSQLNALLEKTTERVEGEPGVIRLPVFPDIVGAPELVPQFQPIVVIEQPSQVFAYESLARYRVTNLLARPDLLFRYAEKKGRVAELEMVCIANSFDTGRLLTESSLLFLNVHPVVFGSEEELCVTLERSSAASGIPFERVVLEITEQSALGNHPDTFTRLRDLGLRFALDDVGVAYSHLSRVDEIKPSFLKISQDFGLDFEKDPTRRKIVANLTSLARDLDCQLILEGIETKATANAATDLGILLGQGFFFRRPADASSLLGEIALRD